MRYIGFDIGDGESAVAAFEQGSGIEPAVIVEGCLNCSEGVVQ